MEGADIMHMTMSIVICFALPFAKRLSFRGCHIFDC